ncbi:MAG TPA: hemerythrin domain-containing protein [Burkholderiales bacterium]|jgi:hemerythrin-like domain-containing protein|nr:hemerythrin domain-containing protein [Burkholderiales bacterium]
MKDAMQKAIRTIRDEHRSISAVLHAMKHLAEEAYRDSTIKPDFQVFRAMIRYIDEYPERLHHPKEDAYLFERLYHRDPMSHHLIDKLRGEHAAGAGLVRELERAMLFLEEGWPRGAYEFREAVNAYAEFHWNHMRKEENELLPKAQEHLTSDDWDAIADAFGGNTDPIADLREKDFAQLFSRIVTLAPAPIGLGEPWKKAAA